MVNASPADIVVRILSAVVGGYALTLLACRALANILPMDGREAATAASLAAWPIYIGAAIWCFAARTPASALVPLVLLAAGLAPFA